MVLYFFRRNGNQYRSEQYVQRCVCLLFRFAGKRNGLVRRRRHCFQWRHSKQREYPFLRHFNRWFRRFGEWDGDSGRRHSSRLFRRIRDGYYGQSRRKAERFYRIGRENCSVGHDRSLEPERGDRCERFRLRRAECRRRCGLFRCDALCQQRRTC